MPSGKTRRWSGDVTRHSDALDLEKDVFKQDDPAKIAELLKRSAERSRRRKGSAFRSAMSMLTFYVNRAGRKLSAAHKRNLQIAKKRLRESFGRTPR
jgi:hypothetical protein